ncbi:MAG: 3-deoxy-manno-octulosonate cytidylyltransferase [Candidatus Marinimicrobia bacterium]|jgi:3-deoxy-manno-octulosonate cytidylyltransferase (CMP-KDO synthetase)|nr:3-deoxy-manno-octulosonate cytidylyltransferase [Candidatus Neomarinimicrobiota bacterium]MBT4064333.1 3-deoxy-manno-octulosonate cytidylyltransferase [Candidatus Neomarinimicrobiota bacterium]MBT4308140.1 3-deoxy-manno-octulosonate cytidylyltransferase [Candidatus Neomarinimicrobiota bacterium]MBT4736861.1 3-deoxy-manno-octulosonate cytidylyltransferase [Candidatus Neomarinimicrobiota bacterium]MBT5777216.1 3-deoxy-manno-octulosonate cytidylyltransferase [Candidatus Neomarinimicrobiota bact
MKAIGVIPARLHSNRFPKKILHLIDGKPMVVHVYERAKKSQLLEDVIVAIDADETNKVLNDWKVKTIMTSDNHVSGTDRIQEAVADIEADVVVNIQGDEPTIPPLLIDELVQQFEDETIEMATVAGKDMDVEKIMDVNAVKVLLDEAGFAVNFRREPIHHELGGYYHHMGIYAYRKSTLKKYTELEPSDNERLLNLEQYRALDNGIPIKVILTDKVTKGIDVIDDLKQLERI